MLEIKIHKSILKESKYNPSKPIELIIIEGYELAAVTKMNDSDYYEFMFEEVISYEAINVGNS